MGHLTGLLEKIQPAVEQVDRVSGPHLDEDTRVEEVARENVLLQMSEIIKHSSILRQLYKAGKIGIAGGMYSVETGEVTIIRELFFDPASANMEAAAL